MRGLCSWRCLIGSQRPIVFALVSLALAGCGAKPADTQDSGADSSASSDTHDTSGPDSPAETADTGATDTAGAETGDTATDACGPYYPPSCYKVDGECRIPDAGPSVYHPTEAPDADIQASVESWDCGVLVWTVCDGGAIAHGTWGPYAETADVAIYDGTTRQWVGGYLTSDDDDDYCGTEVWIGDDAWRDCGRELLDWIYTSANYEPCMNLDTAARTCGYLPPSCIRDEVPR